MVSAEIFLETKKISFLSYLHLTYHKDYTKSGCDFECILYTVCTSTRYHTVKVNVTNCQFAVYSRELFTFTKLIFAICVHCTVAEWASNTNYCKSVVFKIEKFILFFCFKKSNFLIILKILRNRKVMQNVLL